MADCPPPSASIFRGQFDLMLAQWSGRGGGKHYGSSEGLGFVSGGGKLRRLSAAVKVLVGLRAQLIAFIV